MSISMPTSTSVPVSVSVPVPTSLSTHTPISDAQRIDGTIAVGEVRTGDIIFCANPSPLQELCTRAGEPWRHVGMVVLVDGEPSIVEVAGPKFRVRPLTEALAKSTEAAVGRIDSDHQPYAEKAAFWCSDQSGLEQLYAWDDVILTGFIAVTRRFSLSEDHDRLDRMVSAAMSDLAKHQQNGLEAGVGGPQSYTCSAFVVAAFLNAGYSLDFDLGQPRAAGMRPSLWEVIRGGERPLRSACGCRMTPKQTADTVRSLVRGVLAAPARGAGNDGGLKRSEWYRWASPGDIWRSPTILQRLQLEL